MTKVIQIYGKPVEWVHVDLPVLQTEREKPQWIKQDTMKKEQRDFRKNLIIILEAKKHSHWNKKLSGSDKYLIKQ